jgi:hypothetical protein
VWVNLLDSSIKVYLFLTVVIVVPIIYLPVAHCLTHLQKLCISLESRQAYIISWFESSVEPCEISKTPRLAKAL